MAILSRQLLFACRTLLKPAVMQWACKRASGLVHPRALLICTMHLQVACIFLLLIQGAPYHANIARALPECLTPSAAEYIYCNWFPGIQNRRGSDTL